MALKGKLEDMPLLEILQIIAYSKKSGLLRVESSLASGGVLFEAGNVLCAYSSSTLPLLQRIRAEDDLQSRLALVRDQALIALRELITLTDGSFQFERADTQISEVDGVDLKPFFLAGGIHPEDLLLRLAKDIDDDRRDGVEDVEIPDPTFVAEAMSGEGGGRVRLLLVDDEELVRNVVGDELLSLGCVLAVVVRENVGAIR